MATSTPTPTSTATSTATSAPDPRATPDPTRAEPSEIQHRAHAAWLAFCDELAQAGSQLIRADLPLSELDAAEGLRYLSRLVRTGLERHVEGGDPAAAFLHSLCDERTKGFGGDNPDARYFGASISGDYTYQLRGDFRGCAWLSLMTTGFDDQGNYRVTGSLDSDSLPESRTRPVELVLGAAASHAGPGGDGGGRHASAREAEREGVAAACLPTTRDTKSLLVRCTFESPEAKQTLQVALSRTDASGEIVQVALEPISKRLLDTARFVRTTAESWTNQSVSLRRNFNQLPLQDPERIRRAGGDPNVFYYGTAWSVAEDEYLVIRLSKIPECTTWGFQLNNLWTESLDYTQAAIHLNRSSAHYDADGGVTIVVSERDPGVPNWLRTLGHRSGTANLRLMGAKEPVVAEVRVVRDRAAIASRG
ncbi:hypothetical protein K2X89_09705 [Myxococcota bacterium]|nr:hypothetical protein [Myxococcota bacterium]